MSQLFVVCCDKITQQWQLQGRLLLSLCIMGRRVKATEAGSSCPCPLSNECLPLLGSLSPFS